MNATQELTPVAAAAQVAVESDLDRLLQKPYSPRDLISGDGSMEKMLRLAEVMASGKTTIPKHLQGSPGDCMAVITQAMQWNMNCFSVAQKTHLVNGTLGYEAQLVIAVLNNSPLLASRMNFRWADNWAGLNGKVDQSAEHWCEVSARLRGETEPRVLRVSMAQVGGVRNSPNWAADARQQLAYLAGKRWGRLHAPDVILGVYTPDELIYGSGDEDEGNGTSPAAPRGIQRKSEKAAVEPPPFKVDPATGEIEPPKAAEPPAPSPAPAPAPKAAPAQPQGTSSRGVISSGQVAYLRNKLKAAGMTEADASARYGVESIEQLNVDAFDELKSELLAAG